MVAIATYLVTSFGAVASAAPGEPTNPAPNPDLTKACGLDVLVILDESGSIASSNATDDVRRAFTAFVDSLNNTGSSMAVVEFSTVARLPTIGGLSGGQYITITDNTSDDFEDYIEDDYNPRDKTNWEDALRVGRYMAPRPSAEIPHLVVFITDGDPTAVIRNSQVTANEYQNKVPLASNEVSDASGNAGATPAIPNANAQKAVGSHILAVGVGSALQNSQSRQRLVSVSGPNVFNGTGTFDIATHDVYLEEDFSELEEALGNAAFQLCAPSVSIRKLYDPTPDPDSLDDAVPGVGWEMVGTVESVPFPGTFDWVLPTATTGPPVLEPDSQTGVTNGGGFLTFQWTPTNPNGNSVFTVTEDSLSNPPDPPGGGYSNASEETACTFRTPDTGDATLPLDDLNLAGGFTITIPPESIVTCRLVNLADPAPDIEIEKATNGVDADDGFGPLIPVGEPVTWTYLVTNTGNTTLEDVLVIDTPTVGVPFEVDCPFDLLAPGDSMTCTETSTAIGGLYQNTAVVTATDTYDIDVDDVDPSAYFGIATGIVVKKFTQGEDADEPFGPGIPVGDPVNWTYTVSLEPGATVPLENIVLFDDAGTPLDTPGVRDLTDFLPAFDPASDDGDGILEVGEVWEYSATGTAVPGAYENLATVTGESTLDDTEVIDNDPSHYYGIVSELSIIKYTNGADANAIGDPDVPVLRTGSAVLWTYVVTNEGNAPVLGWSVTDDMGTPGTGDDSPAGCPRIVFLPGSSATCHLPGIVQEGQYGNIGTVIGTDIIGDPIPPDTDPSHYVGVTPELTIEKATNTEDADLPTGPFIPVGGPVTWDYVVENTGSADLTGLTVVDFRIDGPPILVTCDQTDLLAGESTDCQATGIAIAGQYTNVVVAVATDPFGDKVGDFDPSHYFGAESAITLEKYTNGVDADEPAGALIPVGGAVEWTYVITNTGNATLDQISLTDDQLGAIPCAVPPLDPGESATCTVTGIAERGQYANIGTVTAVDPASQTVSDTDPSHYFGYLLQIDIEKATNGEDADTPTGPLIPVGDPVTWTYVVTNPGDFQLTNVVVTDDQGVTPVFQGGDTNGDSFLDPGETWTYEATGTSTAGQYANVATVTGTVGDELDNVLTDIDPSHYFGLLTSIDIAKTPDVAVVDIGASHTFEIAVTNTSNVDLTDVEVTDPITPSCDRVIGAMAPGEVVSYSCDVASVTGFINNIASVTGIAPDGFEVSDSDPAAVTIVGAGGTAALGDVVWHDRNRNQVQDAGEPGVPNARVRIELDPGSVTALQMITVVTNSNGEYLATNLVAGTYTVTLDLSSLPGGSLTTTGVYEITLTTGEVNLDADFGIAGLLPFTGFSNFTVLISLASVMLLGGLGVLVWQRRRPSTE